MAHHDEHVLSIMDLPLKPLLYAASGTDGLREVVEARRPRSSRASRVDGVLLRRPVTGEYGGRARRRHDALHLRFRPRLPIDRLMQIGARLPAWQPKLICDVDPATLRPPLILATFHLGPLVAFDPFVSALPGPTIVAMQSAQAAQSVRGAVGPSVEIAVTDDVQQRTVLLRRTLQVLRGGGFALLVADADGGSQVGVSVLGRRMAFAGGPFALSSKSGAPLLPVALTWDGPRVRLVSGAPIEPAEPDAMARALAAWLDGHLRRHPDDLSLELATALGVPLRARGRYVRRAVARLKASRDPHPAA